VPAGNGSLLGSPAWQLVLKPKFTVAGHQVGTMSSGTGINGSDSSVGLLACQVEG
jgi:hypothetical protein